jgi:fluoride ion exporter CrcB/FEX
MNLWRDGESYLAFVNVVAQVMLGLGAVWLGRTIGHELWG